MDATQSTNQLATTTPQRKASAELAAFLGMDARMMIDVIKKQCFKGGNADDAQVAAFVSIAAEMRVNPLLPGMLYAYPTTGGGIVPMMGPDAVFKKLSEHPDVDCWEVTVFPEDVTQNPTHAVASIYMRNRKMPLKYTALMSEWKMDSNPNWKSRPRHMLSTRALKQCARQVIHGIPFDEDERRIIETTATVTEIPKAEVPKITAAAAPAKRTWKQPEPSAQEAEIVPPAPEPDPEPPKPAHVVAMESKLAETTFTPFALLAMAKKYRLADAAAKTLADISPENAALIVDDWQTTLEAMQEAAK